MHSVIDKFDESRIEALEIKVQNQQERYMEIMQANIRLQEKASDAIALAREASAVSKGTAREVEASLTSIRSEVNAAISGINDRMKALQKATTNPLDKR